MTRPLKYEFEDAHKTNVNDHNRKSTTYLMWTVCRNNIYEQLDELIKLSTRYARELTAPDPPSKEAAPSSWRTSRDHPAIADSSIIVLIDMSVIYYCDHNTW